MLMEDMSNPRETIRGEKEVEEILLTMPPLMVAALALQKIHQDL
jgi:hypothetical protein